MRKLINLKPKVLQVIDPTFLRMSILHVFDICYSQYLVYDFLCKDIDLPNKSFRNGFNFLIAQKEQKISGKGLCHY